MPKNQGRRGGDLSSPLLNAAAHSTSNFDDGRTPSEGQGQPEAWAATQLGSGGEAPPPAGVGGVRSTALSGLLIRTLTVFSEGRSEGCRSSLRSDEEHGPEGAESPGLRQVLQEMMRRRDPARLEALGGVAGVASAIAMSVEPDSDGKRLLVADGFSRESEESRRDLFGSNKLRYGLTLRGAGFVDFIAEECQQEACILLFACALISAALGIVECQGGYFNTGDDVGNLLGDTCPQRPIWVSGPIVLPHIYDVARSVWWHGVKAGPDENSDDMDCLAWLGGIGAGLACMMHVLVKAANEDWQIRRLCMLGDWERERVMATVLREGRETRRPAHDVVVGDVLTFTAGDVIAADGVLLHGISLYMDERAALPRNNMWEPNEGECVAKKLGSNPFMLAGSIVVDGEGSMLVTAVGHGSHWGLMLDGGPRMLRESSPDTPMREGLQRLAGRIAGVGMWAACACLVLHIILSVSLMAVYTCFDGLMEDCRNGFPGLNDEIQCSEIGNVWQRGFMTLSIHHLRRGVDFFMSASALLLLLVPHGMTASLSVFNACSLKQCRKEQIEIKTFRGLESMGTVTTICVDDGFISHNALKIEKAIICGVELKVLESRATIGVPRSRSARNVALGTGNKKLTELNLEAGREDAKWPGSEESRRFVWKLLGEAIALNLSPSEAAFAERLRWSGGGVDRALLEVLDKLGIDAPTVRSSVQVIRRWPFSKEQRRGCVLVKFADGTGRVYACGAVDSILPRCSLKLDCNGDTKDLGEAEQEELSNLLMPMLEKGLRTVAFAYADVPNPSAVSAFGLADPPAPTIDVAQIIRDREKGEYEEDTNSQWLDGWLASLPQIHELLATNMVLLGVLGMQDEMAEASAKAIKLFQEAGVEVKIISGAGLPKVASNARRLDCWEEGVVVCDGNQWRGLSNAEKISMSKKLNVMSLATPQDKRSVVRMLQRDGKVVAVLGESMCDVSTLRGADVGISHGHRGDEGARLSSDVVCLDGRLMSIFRLVMRGRLLQQNLRAFVQYRITSSLVVFSIVLLGCLSGVGFIYHAIHLVWMKVLADVGSVIIMAPFDPPLTLKEATFPSKPYAKGADIMGGRMHRMIAVQSAYQVLALGLTWILGRYTLSDCSMWNECTPLLQNGQGKDGAGVYLDMMIFSATIICQLANMVACLCFSVDGRGVQIPTRALLGVLLLASIQYVIVSGGNAFGVAVKLDFWAWLICALLGCGCLLVSAVHCAIEAHLAVPSQADWDADAHQRQSIFPFLRMASSPTMMPSEGGAASHRGTPFSPPTEEL